MNKYQRKLRERFNDDQLTHLVKYMRQAEVLHELLQDRYEWAASALGEEAWPTQEYEDANDLVSYDLIYNSYDKADEIEAILTAKDSDQPEAIESERPLNVLRFSPA